MISNHENLSRNPSMPVLSMLAECAHATEEFLFLSRKIDGYDGIQ